MKRALLLAIGFWCGATAHAADDLSALVASSASRHGLDARLVRAIVHAESDGNPRARSPKGAMGLMQLMPGTARDLGVEDPFDAGQSLEGGCRYLRQLLDEFGEVALALAAYNAGPEAVRRAGGIPDFGETQLYVARILDDFGQERSARLPIGPSMVIGLGGSSAPATSLSSGSSMVLTFGERS